jgi:hypothetical protein
MALVAVVDEVERAGTAFYLSWATRVPVAIRRTRPTLREGSGSDSDRSNVLAVLSRR